MFYLVLFYVLWFILVCFTSTIDFRNAVKSEKIRYSYDENNTEKVKYTFFCMEDVGYEPMFAGWEFLGIFIFQLICGPVCAIFCIPCFAYDKLNSYITKIITKDIN